jgi:hypothetical protein
LEELVVFLLGSSSEKAGPRDDRPTSCGHVALFFQSSLRVQPPPPPQLLPPELHDDEQETQASPDLDLLPEWGGELGPGGQKWPNLGGIYSEERRKKYRW